MDITKKEIVGAIADEINKRVDLPIIGEVGEREIIVWFVRRIVAELDDLLPDWLKNVIADAARGFDMNDDDFDRLAVEVNRFVNIPFMSEEREQFWIDAVLAVVRVAIAKGGKLQ